MERQYALHVGCRHADGFIRMTERHMQDCIRRAKEAAWVQAGLSPLQKRRALNRFAALIWAERKALLRANLKDLRRAEGALSGSMLARLKFDEAKLRVVCEGLRDLARAPDPVHRVLERLELDRGLVLEKRTVPIGVIAVIFESRPDVIPQVLSLILKTGNVALLKGGREAQFTNQAFLRIVGRLNREFKFLPNSWAQLFLERRDVDLILRHHESVNLVIPRGSNELVQSIQRKTKIPVLGHADGVCHLYWDKSADFAVVRKVVIDAKTQYPAVCNALETLIVHRARLKDLRRLLGELKERGVRILGDGAIAAPRVKNWHTEYGDLSLAVRVVKSIDEAVAHINKFGSHHTDGILAKDKRAQEIFLSTVDSATLTINASTRFADGYRFGMGAEVGISTNKIHARGPVGVEGLVTHQFILMGHGHIVRDYVESAGTAPARRFTHRKLSVR